MAESRASLHPAVWTAALGCMDTTMDNWLGLRVDTANTNYEIWDIEYLDLCSLFQDVGNGRATGWQDHSVTVPNSNDPDQTVTFTIGGWNYDAWYGLIDEVTIEQ